MDFDWESVKAGLRESCLNAAEAPSRAAGAHGEGSAADQQARPSFQHVVQQLALLRDAVRNDLARGHPPTSSMPAVLGILSPPAEIAQTLPAARGPGTAGMLPLHLQVPGWTGMPALSSPWSTLQALTEMLQMTVSCAQAASTAGLRGQAPAAGSQSQRDALKLALPSSLLLADAVRACLLSPSLLASAIVSHPGSLGDDRKIQGSGSMSHTASNAPPFQLQAESVAPASWTDTMRTLLQAADTLVSVHGQMKQADRGFLARALEAAAAAAAASAEAGEKEGERKAADVSAAAAAAGPSSLPNAVSVSASALLLPDSPQKEQLLDFWALHLSTQLGELALQILLAVAIASSVSASTLSRAAAAMKQERNKAASVVSAAAALGLAVFLAGQPASAQVQVEATLLARACLQQLFLKRGLSPMLQKISLSFLAAAGEAGIALFLSSTASVGEGTSAEVAAGATVAATSYGSSLARGMLLQKNDMHLQSWPAGIASALRFLLLDCLPAHKSDRETDKDKGKGVLLLDPASEAAVRDILLSLPDILLNHTLPQQMGDGQGEGQGEAGQAAPPSVALSLTGLLHACFGCPAHLPPQLQRCLGMTVPAHSCLSPLLSSVLVQYLTGHCTCGSWEGQQSAGSSSVKTIGKPAQRLSWPAYQQRIPLTELAGLWGSKAWVEETDTALQLSLTAFLILCLQGSAGSAGSAGSGSAPPSCSPFPSEEAFAPGSPLLEHLMQGVQHRLDSSNEGQRRAAMAVAEAFSSCMGRSADWLGKESGEGTAEGKAPPSLHFPELREPSSAQQQQQLLLQQLGLVQGGGMGFGLSAEGKGPGAEGSDAHVLAGLQEPWKAVSQLLQMESPAAETVAAFLGLDRAPLGEEEEEEEEEKEKEVATQVERASEGSVSAGNARGEGEEEARKQVPAEMESLSSVASQQKSAAAGQGTAAASEPT